LCARSSPPVPQNRDRLLTIELAQQLFAEVKRQAKRFMRDWHFTVDATMIQPGLSRRVFDHRLGRAAVQKEQRQGVEAELQYHDVRLIPAQFVKPFVKSNKNDFLGAEAIAEAVDRQNILGRVHTTVNLC
jgi:hypothetical protein